jgi:hypothetical protein
VDIASDEHYELVRQLGQQQQEAEGDEHYELVRQRQQQAEVAQPQQHPTEALQGDEHHELICQQEEPQQPTTSHQQQPTNGPTRKRQYKLSI